MSGAARSPHTWIAQSKLRRTERNQGPLMDVGQSRQNGIDRATLATARGTDSRPDHITTGGGGLSILRSAASSREETELQKWQGQFAPLFFFWHFSSPFRP